ncbi:hypothetical protein [Leptospira yasudae]|uniref:hypothetical protein n=1 Tax=Leptospira yasudae TaxID=2202201 RepID=UPI001F4E72DB|nr:hypothetical protein [Leptospira yasudae]
MKSVAKAGKGLVKSYGKVGKDIMKAGGKALKDVGKGLGNVAQALPDVLQSLSQGGAGGEMPEEEPQEEPIQEEEPYSEETISEEQSLEPEPESLPEEESMQETEYTEEEMNGELGFFPQMAAVQSGVQGITSIVGALDARNERKAKLKSDAKLAQMNALSNIFKPQAKAQPVKRAVSPNPSFSKPAVSKTSEGKLSVSYRSNDAGATTPETKPADNKMLMYGGIAVVIAIVLFIAFKGK